MPEFSPKPLDALFPVFLHYFIPAFISKFPVNRDLLKFFPVNDHIP